MKKIYLSPEDREFFQKVTDSVFTNPFSLKREKLDQEISGFLDTSQKKDIRFEAILRVRETMERLDRERFLQLNQFTGKDFQVMKYAFLFEVFHRFLSDLDLLIEQQIQAGEDPVLVSFALEATNSLQKRGFSFEEALKYLAIFFQFRRAFYFINRRILGTSDLMRELRSQLWNNIFTNSIDFYEQFLLFKMEDFSTVLLGETGTGKGNAAFAIGCSGLIPFDKKKGCFEESFTKSFLSINLSQFPESLIESELFGHKKGAFTGATDNHQGIFGRCSPHGAIFLDEIGEVTVPVQIKLLRVLQERIFSPVGSDEKRRFSGRVIAATNQSLDHLRAENRFRDDFYYRLCSDIIEMPPLRKRIEQDSRELTMLVKHCILNITGRGDEELSQRVEKKLERDLGPGYPWPGNVRELEQSIRSILLKGFCRSNVCGQKEDSGSLFLNQIQDGVLTAKELLSGYCRLLFQRYKTYEDIAKKTELDRRTVKKYLEH